MNLLWKTPIFSFFLFLLIVLGFSSCRSTKPIKKPIATKTETVNFSHYEQKLGFKPKSDFNQKLYDLVIDWLGTPYKYGGCTKSGTDCSCFAFNVYKEVFNVTLPRSTTEIAKEAKSIQQKQLKPGDLIFFNTDGKKISHIGIHLQDDKFVHASTKRGVMISSMNEEYFKKTFKSYGSVF